MRPYSHKPEADLVYEDNRDHIRTQVSLVLRRMKRRLENQAFAEMDRQFQEALNSGEILQLGPSADEVVRIVADMAAQLALEASDVASPR